MLITISTSAKKYKYSGSSLIKFANPLHTIIKQLGSDFLPPFKEISAAAGFSIFDLDTYFEWLKSQYVPYKGGIYLYRVVCYPQASRIGSLVKRDLGIHFSSRIVNVRCQRGKKSPEKRLVFKAFIKPSMIDWEQTLSNRLNYPEEKETTLKVGSRPVIRTVTDMDTTDILFEMKL